jgi:hypothetical protein
MVALFTACYRVSPYNLRSRPVSTTDVLTLVFVFEMTDFLMFHYEYMMDFLFTAELALFSSRSVDVTKSIRVGILVYE